jgi:hypothetical protein
LVLLFTGDTSVAPTEQDSSNVHWASWSALEGAMPFGSSDSGLGFELSLGREEYVNDITLIFLAFDKPINYDDFSLTMADGSPVPKWEHYETTSTIAILCIHGTVKANVALTIEPITITEAPVK